MSDIAGLVTDNLATWIGAVERKNGAVRGGGKRISLYGIERLRALILDLAVRGKLVPQNPTDEPASKLLSAIKSARAKYLSEHGLPKPRTSTEQIDKVPFELPSSWVWTRLGNIAAYIQRGKSPEYSEGSGIYVVSQRCVQWAGLDLNVAKEISEESLDGYEPYRFLRRDDLLWNSTGTGTIGRIIALAEVPEGLVCDSHVTVVRCPWVNARYLQSWLASDDVYGQIEVLAAGSTNQIEWTAQLATMQLIPLPPLAEQRRIVAKVDELMALCDALERESSDALDVHQTLVEALLATLVNSADAADLAANWARLEGHFATLFTTEASVDALKLTILDLAVGGKLVEHDIADEPAHALLERIQAERIKRMGEKQASKLPALPKSEADLPDGWVGVPLGRIGLTMTGGTPKSSQPKNFDGAIPFIGPGQITPTGNILVAEKHISEVGLGQSTEAVPGDVLMVCIGGSIGKSAIVRERMAFNQQINAVRTIIAEHRYIDLYLRSSQFQREVLIRATGSATPIINRSKWEMIPVAIPPLAEQGRIVAKVDELLVLCVSLASRIADAAQTQRVLADAITERAAA